METLSRHLQQHAYDEYPCGLKPAEGWSSIRGSERLPLVKAKDMDAWSNALGQDVFTLRQAPCEFCGHKHSCLTSASTI